MKKKGAILTDFDLMCAIIYLLCMYNTPTSETEILMGSPLSIRLRVKKLLCLHSQGNIPIFRKERRNGVWYYWINPEVYSACIDLLAEENFIKFEDACKILQRKKPVK
ncbi:MAG: hypothetical protein V1934_01735 [Methanobacteriota archaeon]